MKIDKLHPLDKLKTSYAEAAKEEEFNEENFVETTVCTNCGYEYKGNFCPNCGQKKATAKINWHTLFVTMFSEAINFDGRSIRTLDGLWKRPGKTIHEYLGGKYEKYTNPMKFSLLWGFFFVVAIAIFPPEVSYTFYSDGSSIENFFGQIAGNIVVFQCLMALCLEFLPLYWAFKSTKIGKAYTKVDFYIIMLYYLGVDFILRIIFSPLVHCFILFEWLRIFVSFCYLFYMVQQIFELKWYQTLIRYILKWIMYCGFIFVFIIALAIFDSMHTDGRGRQGAMATYTFSMVSGILYYESEDIYATVDNLNKGIKNGEDPRGATSYSIERNNVIIMLEDSVDNPLELLNDRISIYGAQLLYSKTLYNMTPEDSALYDLASRSNMNIVQRIHYPKEYLSLDVIYTPEDLQLICINPANYVLKYFAQCVNSTAGTDGLIKAEYVRDSIKGDTYKEYYEWDSKTEDLATVKSSLEEGFRGNYFMRGIFLDNALYVIVLDDKKTGNKQNLSWTPAELQRIYKQKPTAQAEQQL